MNNNIKNKHLPVLYRLLFTQSISLIGTRMTAIGLGIWLYQLTGQAMDLLLIPLFNEMPSLLFGQVIGTFLDRLKKKTILIASDFGQVLGTVLLFYVIRADLFHPHILYVVVFIQGLFMVAQEPTADAVIGHLTCPENRTRVNGIKELTFPAAGVLAPALGGLLYVNLGILGILAVDFSTFIVSALIVSRLEIPDFGHTKEGETYKGSFFSELKGGMGFLKANKGLLGMVVIMGLFNFLINGPLELVIPFVLETTGQEETVAVMLSVMGVSTALSSVVLSSVLLPKRRMPLFTVGLLVSGAGMLAFSMGSSVFFLGSALFLLMLPLPLMNVIFKTSLQDKVPADLQGRVFATAYQIAYGTAPLSFLLAGSLADHVLEPRLLKGGEGILDQFAKSFFVSTQSGAPAILLLGAGLCLICMSLVVAKLTTSQVFKDI